MSPPAKAFLGRKCSSAHPSPRRQLSADSPRRVRLPRTESPNDPDQTLPPDVITEAGVADAQDHELDRQIQIVDVVKPQKPISRLTRFIYHRQHDARKLGMLVVHEPVRGEMDDAVVRQLRIRSRPSTRQEIDCFEAFSRRSDLLDALLCLAKLVEGAQLRSCHGLSSLG